MSAETLAAISKAIHDHVADEADDAFVLDFVVATAHQTTDDANDDTIGHLVFGANGGISYRERGLLEVARDFHTQGLELDDD